MEKIIEVVDERSFINLIEALEESREKVVGAKASIISDDIMFKHIDKKPLAKVQWVKYECGDNTLKIILRR
jgi:hypothetical protein